MSEAAPYWHFADKEALLAAVAEQGFVGLAASMTLFALLQPFDTGPWQAIAAALMTASTAWIAVAAGRRRAPAEVAVPRDSVAAADHPGVGYSKPAGAR